MENGGLLRRAMYLHLRCTSALCDAQREKTKNGGGLLRDRYKTHVYCRACGTYWERDPSKKGKRQTCPCCKQFCREGPRNGMTGSQRYARKRAAKIARDGDIKINKSIKSEVRNALNSDVNFIPSLSPSYEKVVTA